MTLRVGECQSESELDSIRNFCNVCCLSLSLSKVVSGFWGLSVGYLTFHGSHVFFFSVFCENAPFQLSLDSKGSFQGNFWFGCRIQESAMICSICLFCLVLALPGGDLVPRPIKIASIFDEETNMRHDLMFVNAVKSVNKLRGLLRGVTLVGKASSMVPLSNLFSGSNDQEDPSG